MLRILPWNGKNNHNNSKSSETTTDLTTSIGNDLTATRRSIVQSFVRRSVDDIVGFGNSFVNRLSDASQQDKQRIRDLENELRRVRAHCKLCVEKSWAELEYVEKEKDELLLKCEALEKENFELRHGKSEREEKVSVRCEMEEKVSETSHISTDFENFKRRQKKWFDGLDVSDETRDFIMTNDSVKRITPKAESMRPLNDYANDKDAQQKKRHFSAFAFLQRPIVTTDRERELLEHIATLQDELNELTLDFVEIENQLEEKEDIIAELEKSKEHEAKPQNSSNKSESMALGEKDVELYVEFGH